MTSTQIQLLSVAVLFAGMSTALPAAAQSMPSLQSKRNAPVVYKGLSVVFDASESMCGYFMQGDTHRKLQGLIKKAIARKDPDAGHKVYLLKQQVKGSVDGARDVIEAPVDLQTTAEMLGDKPVSKQGAACAPFNGVDSTLDLIFDAKSPTSKAQSVVLVSDGQMSDKARERFSQGFAEWSKATSAAGLVPYAGVALVQAPFVGRYYSVAEPDARRKLAGYALPKHNRPLLVFWFARGDSHLNLIRDVVGTVSSLPAAPSTDGFTMHLLPFPALGPGWFDARYSTDDALDRFVDAKPALEIKKFDQARSTAVISECLRAAVARNGIIVEAPATCQDGKPIFDGVSEIIARFKLASFPHYSMAVRGDASLASSVAWRLSSRSFGESKFNLDARMKMPMGDRKAFTAFSADADNCSIPDAGSAAAKSAAQAGAASAEEACAEKLEGKVYQLDLLMEQLLVRRQAVSQELASTLGRADYSFVFRTRK